MKRTFVETTVFNKRWRDLNLSDDDLQNLQSYIIKNPNAGDIIVGTGGLTKLRWALPNRGKRGGVRILHVDFTRQKTVFLINCYGKNQKDNISDSEKAMYKTLIEAIRRELK